MAVRRDKWSLVPLDLYIIEFFKSEHAIAVCHDLSKGPGTWNADWGTLEFSTGHDCWDHIEGNYQRAYT